MVHSIFGSEFSALLLHPDISRDIQTEALDYYLSFMCIPAPLTAYRARFENEPGHWLRWRKGEIEIQRYWQPDFTEEARDQRGRSRRAHRRDSA